MRLVTLLPRGELLLDGAPLGPRDDALGLLGHRADLAEGVTLRSWAACLDRHPDLARLGEFLPHLVEESRTWPPPPPIPAPPPGLDRLELIRVVELVGHPGPPRLDVHASLVGMFEHKEVIIKVFPPLALRDAPLVLGGARHRLLGDEFPTPSLAAVFSLFEVIDTVAWHLSFHGGPMECALRR